MSVIHLVDTLEYTQANCFQRQLAQVLARDPSVRTVALGSLVHTGEPIACCLKQRTLHANLDHIAEIVGQTPINIYDQDPWEAVRDGSPYKGVYERACAALNVRSICVTSHWWSQFLVSRGLPARFVRMWMLPELCVSRPTYLDRLTHLGFVGGLHPYRKELFDRMVKLGCPVAVTAGNGLSHDRYLQQVSGIRIYVRAEDAPVIVDGEELNLRDGLWGRDIEVAARGCFSIRNRGLGSQSYLDGIDTVFQCDSPGEVVETIRAIERTDPVARQELIDRAVERIRTADGWQETATALTTF